MAKYKRDIFKFNSNKPTAINLEQVSMIVIDEKKIIFMLGSQNFHIELESIEIAQQVFEELLKYWSGDVLE